MVKCSRCKKRLAVIFVTKMEGGEKKTEGYCLHCAKDIGLPISGVLGPNAEKLGLSPEQLIEMEDEMNSAVSGLTGGDGEDTPAVGDDGGAPSVDFMKLFGDAVDSDEDSGEAPPAGAESDDAATNADAKGDTAGRSSADKSAKHKRKHEFLDKYCKNLTDMARAGRLDKIVGRAGELDRVIQILSRRQKNNPCLIGEPGVGKTAIAEALAQRIAEGNVPYRLKGRELYLVDMTAIIAGTQFRGQFEQRMQTLLRETRAAGNVILVIDEVHNIVGAGDAEGSMNAANIMKPALSRGEIQVIGATTLKEYRKYIEKDAALERRFQPVTVNEPSVSEAIEMLYGIKHYYEDFHSIRISDALLRSAVIMSERYITERYLPDKAIDLLDEAAARRSLSSGVVNETYELRDELLRLKNEREEAEANAGSGTEKETERQYEKIAKIRAEELSLSERLQGLEAECEKVELTSADLADVIELWTGVPASAINENEFNRLVGLEERLRRRIVGQNEAVAAVCRAVKRSRAGISYKRKPVSFIFAGPTGVGKTELVKVLAADLFHTPETLIRIDMSEYMEKYSVSRLIGSPPGYVGYDEAGQLTEKIRRRPYSVVLFDEIEKAHPDVLNILLQILDDGRITDGQGRTVNFENAIIVMTTNAGSERASGGVGFVEPSGGVADSRTEKALASFLRPEFINRVDEIITFRALSVEDFKAIAFIMLGDLRDVLAEKGIAFDYTDDAARLIAERSYSVKYGARNMRRFIQREVEDKLAEAIIADHAKHLTAAHLSTAGDEFVVSVSGDGDATATSGSVGA